MIIGREIESELQGSFHLKKSQNSFLVRRKVSKSDVSPVGTLQNEIRIIPLTLWDVK